MLKRLFLLAVLCSAFVATAQSPTQAKPLAPTHVIVDPPYSAAKSQTIVVSQPKDAPSPFGPEWMIVYITAAYVLISGATLAIIWYQVRVMKKQADIATAASAAATDSANFFANAERARLLTTVNPQTEFDYDVFVTNSGRSPARLTHAVVTAEWVSRGEELPIEPDYADFSDDPAVDYARDEWVLPGDKVLLGSETSPFGVNDDEELKLQFVSGAQTLWLFGMFRYQDSVSGVEYESRFCYHVARLTLKSKPIIFGGGPEAYKGERKIRPIRV